MNVSRSSDLKNLSALFFVQISNYVLPLILVPILASRLGIADYGKLLLIQTIITYANVITDYGFQFSATRKAAIHSDKKDYLQELYANVNISKLILSTITMFIIFIVLNNRNFLYLRTHIFVILVIVFSNAFSALWLFQGLQKMVFQSSILFLTKLANVILTIFLVKNNNDLDKALWCQAISSVAPTILSVYVALKLVGKIGTVSPIKIAEELKDGWPMFKTSIFSALLTNAGITILGITNHSSVVGGYGAVEKIVKALAGLVNPLSQFVYPKLSLSFSRSYQEGRKSIINFSKFILLSGLFLSLVCLLLGYMKIIELFFGKSYDTYKDTFIFLSPWVFAGVLNNILGIQFLSNNGAQKYYSNAFAISSITAIVIYFITIKNYSYHGIILGLIIGEILLSITLFIKSISLDRSLRLIPSVKGADL